MVAPGVKLCRAEHLDVKDGGAAVDVQGAMTFAGRHAGVWYGNRIARGLVRAERVGQNAVARQDEEALGIALHLFALLLEHPSGMEDVQIADLHVTGIVVLLLFGRHDGRDQPAGRNRDRIMSAE